MERFNLNGHLVKVDVQMTKKLYEPFPLVSDESKCKCDDCRYYAQAIMHTSPAILKFFQKFGIDPRKEANVWRACEYDDGTYFYIVDYRIIGEIEDTNQVGWLEVDEAKFSLTNYPVLPSKTLIPPMIELQVEIMIRPEMNKAIE